MDRRTDRWTMQTLELLLYVMYNNMKPCVSNNFVIDFVFDFLKWLLASMSLVLFFMNKNGQSFRDLSSFHVSKLILSWRHVWCFWQNCTWTGQLTHLNRINDLYSYNCPLRWIHCKEIVFDLANDSYPISIVICCPIGWIYGIEIVFDQAYDSVRSLHKYLYRDRISDLYSYILSDRMDIWYRDQKWMLSRIVLPDCPPSPFWSWNFFCWQRPLVIHQKLRLGM